MADDRVGERKTIPSLKIKLKYPNTETFIEKYGENISRGGIFIGSKAPKPVGTVLRFEFLLADEETTSVIRGEGQVIWIREQERPGMGVKFLTIDAASRKIVDRALAFKEGVKRGVYVPLGQDGGEESVATRLRAPRSEASQADVPPNEGSQTGYLPTETSQAGRIPTETSQAGRIPTETSQAGRIPTETSQAGRIPTETSQAGRIPTETSQAGRMPTETSQAGRMPTETSQAGRMPTETSTAAPLPMAPESTPTGWRNDTTEIRIEGDGSFRALFLGDQSPDAVVAELVRGAGLDEKSLQHIVEQMRATGDLDRELQLLAAPLPAPTTSLAEALEKISTCFLKSSI